MAVAAEAIRDFRVVVVANHYGLFLILSLLDHTSNHDYHRAMAASVYCALWPLLTSADLSASFIRLRHRPFLRDTLKDPAAITCSNLSIRTRSSTSTVTALKSIAVWHNEFILKLMAHTGSNSFVLGRFFSMIFCQASSSPSISRNWQEQ